MKGQLFIGDECAMETADFVAPPQVGDLIIYGAQRLRVREVGHNIDRKKLQVVCHAPVAKPAVEKDGAASEKEFVEAKVAVLDELNRFEEEADSE